MKKIRQRKRNKERAARLDITLEVYKRDGLGESGPYNEDETTLQDLLTDMQHYCDREGIDFLVLSEMANVNYTAERNGEES